MNFHNEGIYSIHVLFIFQKCIFISTRLHLWVQDNGVGDNGPAAGRIADPFAPVLIAAVPGPGATAIPTPNEWGVIRLSLMAAGMAMLAVRRRL